MMGSVSTHVSLIVSFSVYFRSTAEMARITVMLIIRFRLEGACQSRNISTAKKNKKGKRNRMKCMSVDYEYLRATPCQK